MNNWLLITPLIGALLGWILNSLLFSSLIYPVTPVKVAGIRFQGLIFNKLPGIAKLLGDWVNENLVSVDKISEKLTGPAAIAKIVPVVEIQINEFLTIKLAEKMPMISMFIGEKTISQIKSILVEEIESLFPVLINQFLQNASKDFNIGRMVEEKIIAIPAGTIQQIIRNNLKKEQRIFKLSGALLGFLVGVLQLIIILLA
jgi:uncharacterized membrane protein YheB (UPF0754 family)